MTPPDAAQPSAALANALQPGERLLWVGRPGPLTLQTSPELRVGAAVVILALLDVGYVTFLASGQSLPGFVRLTLVAVPVILSGVLLTWLWSQVRTLRRTQYALTTTRALAESGGVVRSEPRGQAPTLVHLNKGETRLCVGFGPGSRSSGTPAAPAVVSDIRTSLVLRTNTHHRLAFIGVADVAGLQSALQAPR